MRPTREKPGLFVTGIYNRCPDDSLGIQCIFVSFSIFLQAWALEMCCR
jgi:hypothetical protein